MSYVEFTPGTDAAFAASLHERRVVDVAEKIPLRFIEHDFSRDKAVDDYRFDPSMT